ncbi:MAG: hypothetical protein N2688_02490 [Burkholderiaceae bacterium]|nr:hypothetical protein [Burkholderiaceae bacterium]
MRSATHTLALLLAALIQPAMAQTFAPAPRAVAPATAAHPCMAPPQGQGPTSAECKRECERNPQATQCPRPAATAPAAAPNWGAAPAPASPAPAVTAPSVQAADGSGRTVSSLPPMQPATAATASPQRAPSPSLPAATVAPSPTTASAPPPTSTLSSAARGATGNVAAAPATAAAPLGAAPVVAAGGGSAPPGGLPVRLPPAGASAADANAVAPARLEPPKFDRQAFDVDFGTVYSGEQVRRTVVLNTNARGEAEFRLNIPNAPGFAITEVRVMGQGVVVPPTSATQAPLPSNAPRQLQDSVVRKVVASVKSAPWKVQFNGPSELQIDVLYAPKVDLFNNLIERKMGVLEAGLHNAGGSSGASIALRADFRGLREVNAASLKPRENPIYIVSDFSSPRQEFVVEFDVAAIGAAIDGNLKQAADVPGIRFYGEAVKLPAGKGAVIRAKGFTAWHDNGGLAPDGLPRTVPVELVWPGGSSRTSVDLVPVPSAMTLQSPMLKNCGVQDAHLLIHYSFNGGKPTASGQLTLRNNDPLRTADIFVEARVAGERLCSAYGPIGHGGFTQMRMSPDRGWRSLCSTKLDDYAKLVRGPIEWRCESMTCVGPTPEMCAAAEKSRRENPELWRRR